MRTINPTESLYAGVEPEPCCPGCGGTRCCAPGECGTRGGTPVPNPLPGMQLMPGHYDVRGFQAPAHCGRNFKGILLTLAGPGGLTSACIYGPFITYPHLYAQALRILRFGDPELRVQQVLVSGPRGSIPRSVALLWNRRPPHDQVGELLTSTAPIVVRRPVRFAAPVAVAPRRRRRWFRRNP